MFKKYQKAMGVFQLSLGAFIILYLLLWLVGIVRWSMDIVLIPIAVFGISCFVSGLLRIKRGRALFSFKNKFLDISAKSVFALGIAVVLLLQGMIIYGCTYDYDGDAEYAVVLGAKIVGSTPSLMFQKRIEAAAEYLLKHPETKVIACGGTPSGGSYSEAEVCRMGLIKLGVDEERILLDENSYDTAQSAVNAGSIMENSGGAKRVAVVTSDYHVFRSVRLFRNMGYEAYGVGADVMHYLRPIAHFREMLSLMRDFVFG